MSSIKIVTQIPQQATFIVMTPPPAAPAPGVLTAAALHSLSQGLAGGALTNWNTQAAVRDQHGQMLADINQARMWGASGASSASAEAMLWGYTQGIMSMLQAMVAWMMGQMNPPIAPPLASPAAQAPPPQPPPPSAPSPGIISEAPGSVTVVAGPGSITTVTAQVLPDKVNEGALYAMKDLAYNTMFSGVQSGSLGQDAAYGVTGDLWSLENQWKDAKANGSFDEAAAESLRQGFAKVLKKEIMSKQLAPQNGPSLLRVQMDQELYPHVAYGQTEPGGGPPSPVQVAQRTPQGYQELRIKWMPYNLFTKMYDGVRNNRITQTDFSNSLNALRLGQQEYENVNVDGNLSAADAKRLNSYYQKITELTLAVDSGRGTGAEHENAGTLLARIDGVDSPSVRHLWQ